jgi:putative aldouronate transport system substrate-binding protein
MLAILMVCGFVMSFALTALAEVDTSEFVTVRYVMLGNKPTNGQLEKVAEKWNAILKEKVNAHLELQWVEWADWRTKYNLLLASGEQLDLITTATDWLDAWPNAERGAFMDMTDLLPEYAPKTWAQVPPEHWEECKYDGKIVLIPEDNYTQWINHGLFYRGDWAKEFGIELPIMDWETMGKYFQGVKDNKEDVVPWDAQGSISLAGHWFVSHTPVLALEMVPTGYIPVFWAESYDEKYTAVSPIFDDTFIEFAKTMKEWGDAGYWREDVLNYKGDTRELLRAGLSGSDQHHTQTFRTLRVEMDDLQPGSELGMFVFGEQNANLISMSITHGATAIGAHSKNPERALMVYDLIRNDEELYRLVNYGIEGVQYIIEDGVMKRPEGYDRARDQFYSDYWGGRMDEFELPMDMVWPRIGEYYERYDKIKKPYPYGRFVFERAPIEAELAAISDVTAQLGPAICFGKAGDPVQAVEDFRMRVKLAGYDTVMAELQKQLDEYKVLVEGE